MLQITSRLLRAAVQDELRIQIKIGLGVTGVIPTAFSSKADAAVAIIVVSARIVWAAAVFIGLDFVTKRHAGIGGYF